MYRLGSYKGVNGVFLRFFEMFFPGHALSRQNKALKDSRDSMGVGVWVLCVLKKSIYMLTKKHTEHSLNTLSTCGTCLLNMANITSFESWQTCPKLARKNSAPFVTKRW